MMRLLTDLLIECIHLFHLINLLILIYIPCRDLIRSINEPLLLSNVIAWCLITYLYWMISNDAFAYINKFLEERNTNGQIAKSRR